MVNLRKLSTKLEDSFDSYTFHDIKAILNEYQEEEDQIEMEKHTLLSKLFLAYINTDPTKPKYVEVTVEISKDITDLLKSDYGYEFTSFSLGSIIKMYLDTLENHSRTIEEHWKEKDIEINLLI